MGDDRDSMPPCPRACRSGQPQLKMVTLVNPGNPTGVMIPRATIEQISSLCEKHGVWLVLDNTYEHFAYDGCPPHACLEGDHIINVFSFSKAYGMMGWRVGYLAYPPRLGPELFKVPPPPSPCTCHAHAMHMPCTCHAHAMHMPCTCHAHAMHRSRTRSPSARPSPRRSWPWARSRRGTSGWVSR